MVRGLTGARFMASLAAAMATKRGLHRTSCGLRKSHMIFHAITNGDTWAVLDRMRHWPEWWRPLPQKLEHAQAEVGRALYPLYAPAD
jgi:hypothetical protein